MNFKFFLLFCFVVWGSFSQELPPIQNYPASTYGGANQNWSISQTKDKFIYVANNSGLLEFNGSNWELYPSPNGSVLRAVKAVNSRVYTGCYMEFGYWEKNNQGILIYTSISNKVENELKEDEHFWNIIAYKDWVLFQSQQHIFIYSAVDKVITTIDAPTTNAHIFKVNNTIYFQKNGEGVFTIQNGEAVSVSNHPILKENTVVGVFMIDSKVTVLLETGLFYFLEDNSLIKWQTDVESIATEISVFSSKQLQDGSLVLGTISNGIFHLNKKGGIVNEINQEKGLHNNTVLSIFEDVDNNLWLALDNGLCVINLKSPFKEYIDKVGRLGQVYAAIEYKGFLYLGTNQGLFFKAVALEEEFQFIPKTKGQVWSLNIIEDDLFCGHNNGTYVIKNNTALLISDIPGTWDIKPFKNNSNLLIQGNYKGLSVLERSKDSWKLRNRIEGFSISSRFLEWVDVNNLVVNHENKGVFFLKFDPEFKNVINNKMQVPYGSGASLATFNGQLIYATNDGIFSLDKTKLEFVGEESLNQKFFNREEPPFGVLITDKENKRLWGFSKNSILGVSPSQLHNGYELIEVPLPQYFRNTMGLYGFESLTALDKNNYLIGTTNGFVTLNLNKVEKKEYKVAITAMKNNPGDARQIKMPLEDYQELKFKENSIAFSYGVSEYNKYEDVAYQYMLSKEHPEWSIWSSKTEVNFENLPYGEYTFTVRASVNNSLTEPIRKTFIVLRPWYLSYLALIVYLLFFALLVLVIHKQYKRYYRKQQELIVKENRKKLKRKEQKAQRKIVEITNEKLKEEIKSKNRELASSTMSIIKKNQFLNVIKSQLLDTKTPQEIKSVIRTIDRNINNVDDWKLFEEAFNNADKDFLKKIKELHTDLTPNDLRLCAYLRLNLSSKEIAPLLNISSRSVEVKRYRLRKKINLEHEKGLVDYILSI